MNDWHDELSTVADWLFKGWDTMARVIVIGVLAYVGLLIILRTSGKRTLSKMNATDEPDRRADETNCAGAGAVRSRVGIVAVAGIQEAEEKRTNAAFFIALAPAFRV